MSGPLAFRKKEKRKNLKKPSYGGYDKWNRNKDFIKKSDLERFYLEEKKSMHEITQIFGCSTHKIFYWMNKYEIPRRLKSEATYVKRNPGGDPFCFRFPKNDKERILFGAGLGIYWGEGTKSSKNSIRLGSTDPGLLKVFLDFLTLFFDIKKEKIKFGLQIFSDIKGGEALDFWKKELKINKNQFNKIIITRQESSSTYGKKDRFGVLTVYYHNKKARDILINLLTNSFD